MRTSRPAFTRYSYALLGPGSRGQCLGHMFSRAFGASDFTRFWRHWNPFLGYFDFVILTMLLFARLGAARVGFHGPLAQTMSPLHLPDDLPLIDIAPRQKVRQQHFDVGAA